MMTTAPSISRWEKVVFAGTGGLEQACSFRQIKVPPRPDRDETSATRRAEHDELCRALLAKWEHDFVQAACKFLNPDEVTNPIKGFSSAPETLSTLELSTLGVAFGNAPLAADATMADVSKYRRTIVASQIAIRSMLIDATRDPADSGAENEGDGDLYDLEDDEEVFLKEAKDREAVKLGPANLSQAEKEKEHEEEKAAKSSGLNPPDTLHVI